MYEQDFRLVIDSIPGLIVIMTPEGEVEYINQPILDYFARTFDDMKKWAKTDAVHEEDLSRVMTDWKHAIESGILYKMEYRIRRADGVYRWFQSRVLPLHDSEGRILHWYGLLMDIDNQKQAEEALRTSNARFEGILEIAEDAIISIDFHQRIILFNKGAEKVFGYTQAEIIGSPLELLLPQRFGNVHRKHIEEFAHSPEAARMMGQRREVSGRRKDGSEFPAEASISKLNLGGEMVFTVILRDISVRKQVEEKIRQEQEHFRLIVEAVPCLSIAMTPELEFLYANNNLLNYTGKKQEDLRLGNFRQQLFHPMDVVYLDSIREGVLKRAKRFETECRILSKDGKYKWFLARLNPLKDKNEKVVQWVSILIDIHDRKLQEEKVRNENIALKEEIDKTSNLEIMGVSKQIQYVLHLISLVAKTNSSVLILGETGTGKELVARTIHKNSNRKEKLMIKVNCAAIPADLIESELFGHEKGSFTGAIERRIGKFEMANHSTLFLDEIGELPLGSQVKLLRVLQELEFERLGGKETIKIDVRIIAASNRDLLKEIRSGNFRSDLYYRLNVFPIIVPPLRERKDDIPILANHFLAKSSKNIGKKINSISSNIMEELMNYNWPGNVRELEHLMERSVILNENIINEVHLPQIEPKEDHNANRTTKTIHDNEREYILSILKKCKGKKGGADGAAVLLGIPVSTLNSKIKRLGITKEQIYLP